MPLTTKHWKWKESAKAANVCARGSVRVLKPGKRTLIRVCCPKRRWVGGRCRVSLRRIAVAKRRKR